MNGIRDFNQLKPNKLLEELIIYIENELPNFKDSQSFKKALVIKNNETQHSTAFTIFMNKNQDLFTFTNEVAQKGSSKIDVAVILKSTDDIIFTIEAKVLPTPKGNNRKPRGSVLKSV